MDDASEQKDSVSSNCKFKSITYSNLCGGVSAKSQLMLCAAFSESNDIDIIGNESEIVTLDYLPVLRHYLESQDIVNSVVVFSTGIFGGNRELASKILDIASLNNKQLIFCAEGIFYSEGSDKNQIMDLVRL